MDITLEKVEESKKDVFLYRLLQYSLFEESLSDQNDMNEDALFEYPWFENFQKNITFFVGENGTGKSTLIKAIAVAYGFNPEGGTMNYRFSTFDDVSQLSSAIRMVKGYRRAKSNYFFRAESFLMWPVKRKTTGI